MASAAEKKIFEWKQKRLYSKIIEKIDDDDPHLRQAAQTVLVDSGPEAVEPLLKSLRSLNLARDDWHKDKKYEINARMGNIIAWLLGKIGDKRAIASLKENFPRHGSGTSEFSWALGELGDESVIDFLIDKVKRYYCGVIIEEHDACSWESAARALIKLSSTKALPALQELWLHSQLLIQEYELTAEYVQDEDYRALKKEQTEKAAWDIKKCALQAIVHAGGEEAAKILLGFEDSEAMEALVSIGDPARDVLWNSLTSPGPHPRGMNIKALILAELGDKRPTEMLVDALWESASFGFQNRAARALDKLGWQPPQDDKGAMYHVVRLFREGRYSASYVELKKMGGIASRAIASMLERQAIYAGDSRSINEALVDLLIEIGPRAAKTIVECIKDHGQRFRRFAEKYSDLIVPVLQEMLASGAESVRKGAALLLEQTNWMPAADIHSARYYCAKRQFKECEKLAKVAIAPLLELIGDRVFGIPPEIAAEAIQTLEKLGVPTDIHWARYYCATKQFDRCEKLGKSAVTPLLWLLEDTDPKIRQRVVQALGNIKDSSAVDHLIKLLDDKEVLVIRAAAKALGKIGDLRAAIELQKKIDDPDEKIRENARQALDMLSKAVP